jgi:hypothetical protein
MSREILGRIQNAIRRGDYDVTFHASEEMAEDELDIYDAEASIFGGDITKTERDERGEKYTIVGPSTDGKINVGTVGRFKETGIYLIITVFEAIELE